ncbi:MAG TPA: hypothetical protein VGF28_16975 [Thermoanaerobaculia bacterium]|jgi:hypothetical protein
MTWIRTIPLGEAGDELRRLVEQQRALYPGAPVPNNPGWNSLRLERRATARMTPEEWRRYKLTHVGTGVEPLQ